MVLSNMLLYYHALYYVRHDRHWSVYTICTKQEVNTKSCLCWIAVDHHINCKSKVYAHFTTYSSWAKDQQAKAVPSQSDWSLVPFFPLCSSRFASRNYQAERPVNLVKMKLEWINILLSTIICPKKSAQKCSLETPCTSLHPKPKTETPQQECYV